jgi:hypothetical protein
MVEPNVPQCVYKMPRQWTCEFRTEPPTMHDKFKTDRTVQVCANYNLEDLMHQQVGRIVLQSSLLYNSKDFLFLGNQKSQQTVLKELSQIHIYIYIYIFEKCVSRIHPTPKLFTSYIPRTVNRLV